MYVTVLFATGGNMLTELRSDFAPWFPQTDIEAAQVREQLERMLSHPLFCHSKRYPGVLRYVVEETLQGRADQIKERNIGIEVFGREPNYDVSANPVVRFTASEIRKRLAQYYIDPSHSGELYIDLLPGSYVPVFHKPADSPELPPPATPPEPGTSIVTDARIFGVNESKTTLPATAPAVISHRRWPTILGALLCAALIGMAGLVTGLWLHPPPAANKYAGLDRFWAPVISASGIATLCIGEHHGETSKVPKISAPEKVTTETGQADQSLLLHVHDSGRLNIPDVLTLTHMGAALEMRGKPFRVLSAPKATFSQLREGPVILVGAFDNIWSVRLTQNLRYSFVVESESVSIVDRRNPMQARWSTRWDIPYRALDHDYAIVARFHDSTTGQVVVLVAGIAEEGTEAAGEFLSNPDFFAALLKQAPANWATANMETVLETEVIDGRPGPPRILAVEFW